MRLPIRPRTLLIATTLLPILAVVLAAGTVGAESGSKGIPIEPGKWEFKSTSTNPMTGTPTVRTDTRCVVETSMSPERFLKDAPQKCDASDIAVDGQTMSWKMVCQTPMGPVEGSSRMKSTGETVEGEMKMQMTMMGSVIEIKNAWEGKRLGACEG